MTMKPDIEIARSVKLRETADLAVEYGIPENMIEPYGRHVAKIPYTLIDEAKVKKSKLILVTAITATKTGIGKTTASIGLALGMRKLGKKVTLALREPSLGPCFGMKGGAAGGGYAQVVPMEKINLHFTGDFHAVTSAHNMIAALLDNYLYQHQAEGFALKEILWKRVLDVNDRSLRSIVTGLGPRTNGLVQESGFDITPASEIMAILCLRENTEDLKKRIGNILLGYTFDGKPFTVKDMGIEGAIAALLVEAINPNMAQTTEGGAAFIHGGPFANIAHGCNSVLATKMAMNYGEYAITEAGFGADLGAEKFLNIKCRKSGLTPVLTLLVVSLQGLKMHGNISIDKIKEPSPEGVEKGFCNMDRHIENLQAAGQTVLVCFNKYATDTKEEIDLVRKHCEKIGVAFALNDAYAKGGEGALELAAKVIETIDNSPSSPVSYTYQDQDSICDKIEKVARKIYRAGNVSFSKTALKKIAAAEEMGMRRFPVCIAKTQYSFSQDQTAYGAPEGFEFDIKDIVINAGAEMTVAIAGDIIRMPGLPKHPQALDIDVNNGYIDGLS